jgi:hypothetical protein
MDSVILAERERLTQRVTECAEAALAGRGCVERAFRLDGRCFVMRFAGRELAEIMTRALNHLATEERGEVALTIDCWDVAGSGLPMPMPDWPKHLFMARGEVRGLDGPEMRVAYFDWIKLLNVYLPEARRAFYCIDDAGQFPVQQLGSPALTIFSWWGAMLGWQFIHAAAVGTARGAVLVAGHGGAGKSTLAFSTLKSSPLRYLSDDYCMLAPGEPARVLAIFSSGKLTEMSLCLLQHLRKHASNANDRAREKAVFFLQEQFPEKLLAQAPLRAIVLSRISSFETALAPVSWSEVMGVLAESTIRQLAGTDGRDFMRMMRCARGLPIHRLDHGLDSAATHKLLLQLCES